MFPAVLATAWWLTNPGTTGDRKEVVVKRCADYWGCCIWQRARHDNSVNDHMTNILLTWIDILWGVVEGVVSCMVCRINASICFTLQRKHPLVKVKSASPSLHLKYKILEPVKEEVLIDEPWSKVRIMRISFIPCHMCMKDPWKRFPGNGQRQRNHFLLPSGTPCCPRQIEKTRSMRGNFIFVVENHHTKHFIHVLYGEVQVSLASLIIQQNKTHQLCDYLIRHFP